MGRMAYAPCCLIIVLECLDAVRRRCQLYHICIIVNYYYLVVQRDYVQCYLDTLFSRVLSVLKSEELPAQNTK